MKIKIIEQLKFKMIGRSIPVINCMDVEETGKIHTLHIVGNCRSRDNSILRTWDGVGWEKSKDTTPIRVIDEKGNESFSVITSESGETVNLYTKPSAYPNRSEIIGRAATMDDIAEAMDLGKSMRNIFIGIIFGAPVWWIVFQILGAMMK